MPTLTERVRNPIGTHVLTGKGLAEGAYQNACKVGAETIQVFCGNPRGWALSAGDPRDDRRFRELCAEAQMRVFIHTPYLVNLGSPDPVCYQNSVALVAHNLKRAAQIGAEGVVVHTGSSVQPGLYDAALRQVRKALLPMLDVLDDNSPWLLLEPTAGQGQSLCSRVEELAPYLEALNFHPRAGICFDTCHFFAAGEPLDEPGGTTRALDRIVEIGGPDRLRLVHANDSMDVRGARRDRHEKIGAGHVGVGAFKELFAHQALAGVPFILETPGSRTPGDPSTALLRALRSSSADPM
ncbi:deoxyribonuclease IV [Hoyosella sp. YIM 151337]|uniref:deoxyribonuclease IV n=1 Tax=Hoyosella sp. YIM 151337 TaxID=2992742 RepID=UPI002235479F|nr:deoxyribonuclease IV [Hoyosella sp. YIM 151337]MCW4354296.1 deoxyribonuclease IV [Hoyosella sp. YIM 151337]